MDVRHRRTVRAGRHSASVPFTERFFIFREVFLSSVVDQLWELQNVLSQLAKKEQELNTKPESFAAVDQEFQAANAEIERLNAGIEGIARERRRIEGELQDAQELLKKYQGQLMQVKNQQQYSAAWKEIDNSRRQVKELEESLLKQMTDSDELQNQMDERKGGFDELKSRHDEQFERWQHSLGDLRAEIETIRSRQANVESRIPEKLRAEFHRIYRNRQGVAVAAIESGACTGCHVRLRPQALQQVRRGEVTFCEGCHRILYLETVTS
jgi:predicted  nucleic acid-binding Zn-ribbon protein